MTKPKQIDRDEIGYLHANGLSDIKISKILGCAQLTVWNIRNKELKLPTNFVAWRDMPPSKIRQAPINQPQLLRVRTTFAGARGSRLRITDLVKPEFASKGIRYFPVENRTEIIRFFYSIFKEDLIIDQRIAKRITGLLKTNRLTRSEIHAVLYHLGYRYSSNNYCFRRHNRNISIDGYYDGRLKFTKNNPDYQI